MRSNAAQREREGYLRFVVPYLMDLSQAPPPRGIDFQGKIFETAERIIAEIKLQLIDDPSLNWLNAEHRVQQLVDQWIAIELRTEQPEMKG